MSEWRDTLGLDGEGPVYDQIKRALTEKITAGDWEPGDRIPPEEELAQHFDTARMTVNRALREMADEGWIVRRRGAGSFVAPPPSPTALLEIVDMSRAIPASGRRYGYECIEQVRIEATGRVAEVMRLPEGSPVRRVVCRHLADGEVIELEERWINVDLLPEAATQDFTRLGPGGWLLSAAPWTEAEHTVRAVAADGRLAERLGVECGDPCLVLERRTFQDERVVTWARLSHPGDRHVLRERFSPGR